MALTSKNPVVGFVPCQHCGKPSPTHYPKGGPRKNKLYYNCLEHKNQSSVGVAEYCEAHQEPTLEAFATKYDAFDECNVLRAELENAGLLETVIEDEDDTPPLTVARDDLELDLPDTDTSQTKPPVKDVKPSSIAPIIFILAVVVVLALVAYFIKRKAALTKPNTESAAKAPESQPEKVTTQPATSESVPQTGVLI